MFSNFDDVGANGQFTENEPGIGDRFNRPDLPSVQPTTPVVTAFGCRVGHRYSATFANASKITPR